MPGARGELDDGDSSTLDGRPKRVRRRPTERRRRDRARRLLKHLVVQRRPVARDAVLGLLWEDVEPTVAGRYEAFTGQFGRRRVPVRISAFR